MSIAGKLIKEINERKYADWKAAAANDDSLDDVKEVKINKFKVNDFVYCDLTISLEDMGKYRYGIVKEVLDNENGFANYVIDFKFNEIGLPCETYESVINEQKLEDGKKHIEIAINDAQQQIQNLQKLQQEVLK